MKKTIPLFCLLLILATANAQHCPFDGSSAVLIRLLDTKGLPVTDTLYACFLAETDTAISDSCTYAEGPIHLPFRDIGEELIKKYNGGWETRAATYVKETTFNQKGYRVIVLNQAETYCMLKRGNDFDFHFRTYEIQVMKAGQKIKTIPVEKESIYNLCSSAGKWSRIIPVEIVLED
ncbi:MAG: hypothetical protein U0U70_01025 [Chitinophagaceae bacterium]